jgi:hypothetical protein
MTTPNYRGGAVCVSSDGGGDGMALDEDWMVPGIDLRERCMRLEAALHGAQTELRRLRAEANRNNWAPRNSLPMADATGTECQSCGHVCAAPPPAVPDPRDQRIAELEEIIRAALDTP